MGFMGAMGGSGYSLSQRQVRRPARYDLFCSGYLLCADDRRHFYIKKKTAQCGKTLQSLWLPTAAGFIHSAGHYLLHLAHLVQAAVYLAGPYHCTDRYSHLLFPATEGTSSQGVIMIAAITF